METTIEVVIKEINRKKDKLKEIESYREGLLNSLSTIQSDLISLKDSIHKMEYELNQVKEMMHHNVGNYANNAAGCKSSM